MDEIHDHSQELRSTNELLVNLHGSGRYEERKVTRSHRETWAAPRTKETGASPVILSPRTILTDEKK